MEKLFAVLIPFTLLAVVMGFSIQTLRLCDAIEPAIIAEVQKP